MSAPSESDGSMMMMSAVRPDKDWCPTCRAAMNELDGEAARLGNITVVVVNYDRASELKRKYGISYQHTYVQIDAEGNKIALWRGGGIDGVLKNVVRASM